MTGEQAAAWTCPSCERTVPGRVDTCYCGTDRAIAARLEARAVRTQAGPPWAAIGALLAAGAVVALGLFGGATPPETEPTQPAAASPEERAPLPQPTPPTPRPRGRRWREPPNPAPTPAPSPLLAAIPTRPAEPTEKASPEPTSETSPGPNSMEVRRAEGKAAFEAALNALDPEVQIVRRKLRIYEDGCRTSTDVVQPGGCGILEVEIRQILDDIDRSVASAEEEARRSWVQPGTQRDVLQNRELDSASRGRMRREIESVLR